MRALILVDIQNDFLPGGSLAVDEGDRVRDLALRIQDRFPLVVATQDYHPPKHCSFASTHGRELFEEIAWNGQPQRLWPDHCVEGTHGAELAAGLDLPAEHVFRKGLDVNVDSYSGFFDNDQQQSTGLDAFLRDQDVDEVYIMGVATDYCVAATAIDAAQRCGLRTIVIEDGCRGTDYPPGRLADAIARMKAAGVEFVTSEQLPERLDTPEE